MDLHQYRDVDKRGTITRVTYEATNSAGERWTKYANVYLPYGYDENQKYDIVYLMHGGGGNPDAWLDCAQIKNALDRGFEEGRAKPFIVVFPTYYNLDPTERRRIEGVNAEWENEQIRAFQKELAEDLIPAVESRFSTYAKDTTPEGLAGSRQHRAFGGFSMGGGVTWYVFLYNLEIVSVFLPLSGDCWEIQPMGGRLVPEETAKVLAERTRAKGMTAKDFRIYGGTGDKDMGLDNMKPMLEAMTAYPDLFDLEEDPAKGNLHLAVKEDAVHAYEQVYHHVWHYLPYLF